MDSLMVTLERIEGVVTGTLIALLIFLGAFAICLIVVWFLPGEKKDTHRSPGNDPAGGWG